MNSYIQLDGCKYRTRNYKRRTVQPSTVRQDLSGGIDVTFGPAAMISFNGDIIASNSNPDNTWGCIDDLRSALVKRDKVCFIDHFGNEGWASVTSSNFDENTLMNTWDSASNKYYVTVTITVLP